jgi:hypothetical protein
MRRAAIVDDLLVAGRLLAVQHAAAGETAGIAEAEHDLAGLVQMIEHHAGRSVLVGKRAGSRTRIGVSGGCEARERSCETESARPSSSARHGKA